MIDEEFEGAGYYALNTGDETWMGLIASHKVDTFKAAVAEVHRWTKRNNRVFDIGYFDKDGNAFIFNEGAWVPDSENDNENAPIPDVLKELV